MLERFRARLHALLHRDETEAEFDEEIQAHVAREAERNREQGMSEPDAMSAARRAFGNLGVAKDSARETWTWVSAEGFVRDLRFAIRSLRRAPAFAALAVLSIGIGIGLSTSVYAMIDRLTHPLTAYANVDELFRIQAYGYAPGRGLTTARLFDAIPRGGQIAAVTMQTPQQSVVDASGIQDQRWYSRVAPNFFDVLGVPPRLGRVFRKDEMASQSAVIISDGLWRSRFRSRSVIGDASITLGDQTYAVVGVMPPNFERYPLPIDVWLPYATEGAMHDAAFGWITIRARSGASADDLRAPLNSLAEVMKRDLPAAASSSFSFRTFSLRPDPLKLSGYHRAMIGAVVGVLLIACANVCALMLARGLGRQRDSALRLSLGATRAILVQDVFAEVLILTAAGCAVGLVAAGWALSALVASIPPEIAWLGLAEPSWSWRVFAAAFGAALLSAALASILPAIQASRVDPAEPLKDSAGTTTGRAGSRFKVLVVAELALSMVLLVGASLMIKATIRVAQYDFGFDASAALTVFVSEPASSRLGPAKRRSTDDLAPVIDRIRTVAGVDQVTSTSTASPDSSIVISEATASGAPPLALKTYQKIGLDYVKTLGLRVNEGRDVNAGDRRAGGVILEARTARLLFPRGSAVGRMIKLGGTASAQPWIPVVGVVSNTNFRFFDDPDQTDDPKIFVYAPSDTLGYWRLIVRQSSKAHVLPLAIQRRVRDGLGSRANVTVAPLLANYDQMLRGRYFIAGVFALLGVSSLALAVAGLFSVLSYAVGQRMREFAVRVALGAEPEDLLRLVLRDALELALGGTAVGAVGGMWAGTLLTKVLYDVHPADVTALVSAEAILLIVTLLASLIPALRAMRADPLEVLRAT